MFAITMFVGLMGYGVGFEGYDDSKLYFGVYTPEVEYGWVVTNDDIYLDTILEKRS
jgi:hypothetical protein